MVSIQTPLGQFLKLPLLVEHYLKHQKQEGISFVDFLEDHYASDHKDADQPEDEHLPFKNMTVNNLGYAILAPSIQTTVAYFKPAEKKISSNQNYTPQLHLKNIFHPPQV